MTLLMMEKKVINDYEFENDHPGFWGDPPFKKNTKVINPYGPGSPGQ